MNECGKLDPFYQIEKEEVDNLFSEFGNNVSFIYLKKSFFKGGELYEKRKIY